MKHTQLRLMLITMLFSTGSITYTEPSIPRKITAGIASPFVTLGAFSLAGLASDTLVKNIFGITSSLRPWLIGAITAYACYKTFLPTTHFFYTLLADDAHKLIALVGKNEDDKGIIQDNEEFIREILREIFYVKNELVNDFERIHVDSARRDTVLSVLNKGIFSLNGVASIIGDTNVPHSRPSATCVLDVLKNTQTLVSKKTTSNSHWWSHPFAQKLFSIGATAKKPFVYAQTIFYDKAWIFQRNSRLLVTLGGQTIEDAAKNLCKTVETAYINNSLYSSDTAEKLFLDFYNHAQIIVDYAQNILKELKAQREEIQRIRDIALLFKKPSSDIDDEFDDVCEYSMHVLSLIHA